MPNKTLIQQAFMNTIPMSNSVIVFLTLVFLRATFKVANFVD